MTKKNIVKKCKKNRFETVIKKNKYVAFPWVRPRIRICIFSQTLKVDPIFTSDPDPHYSQELNRILLKNQIRICILSEELKPDPILPKTLIRKCIFLRILQSLGFGSAFFSQKSDEDPHFS